MAYTDRENFEFMRVYVDIFEDLVKSGYLCKFRLGTSMHRLVLSRSKIGDLREEQKYLMFAIAGAPAIQIRHNLDDEVYAKSVIYENINTIKEYVDRLMAVPFD